MDITSTDLVNLQICSRRSLSLSSTAATVPLLRLGRLLTLEYCKSAKDNFSSNSIAVLGSIIIKTPPAAESTFA